MGNQRNKPKIVDCHLVEFVEIIEPFKGETFVIDDEFDESKLRVMIMRKMILILFC
jgi:hypothetical protein